MQDIHFLIGFNRICMHMHMFWKLRRWDILEINKCRDFKKKIVTSLTTAFLRRENLFLINFYSNTKKTSSPQVPQKYGFLCHFPENYWFSVFSYGFIYSWINLSCWTIAFFCGCWSVMYAVCIRFPLFDKGNGYVHQHDFHWPVNRFAMIWRSV